MGEPTNDVMPFKALHYNPDKIADIGLCLSQPYDVINPEQRERYAKQHENNIVRLTLPEKKPGDTEDDNRYTRSRDALSEWVGSGVLCEARNPSFWAYEQEFTLSNGTIKNVKGFIGLVRLQDYQSMKILPHEKVLKNPVEDRIRLTKETNTQFEYIWGVYRDKSSKIDETLAKHSSLSPIIDFFEEDKGVRHRFRRISDSEHCKTITSVMAGCKIYIADGHHRYQTMLSIRDEHNSPAHGAGPDAPWNFIMMFLTNSEAEGLTILPTHRMLHDLGAPVIASCMPKIEKYFDVASISFDDSTETKAREEWLSSIRLGSDAKKKVGLYLTGTNKYLVLALKNENDYMSIVSQGSSKDWKMLDVNIANFLLLRDSFDISEEELALGAKIKYAVDPNEAADKVKSGAMDAGIILNPTRLDQVLSIADNREIMPRKSTFFYPKPLSGLVMYRMDRKP